jgi:hypothetical protein
MFCSQLVNDMVRSPFQVGLRHNEKAIVPGAQTERRGGAGPARGLLGGKDPTGRFSRRLSAP